MDLVDMQMQIFLFVVLCVVAAEDVRRLQRTSLKYCSLQLVCLRNPRGASHIIFVE